MSILIARFRFLVVVLALAGLVGCHQRLSEYRHIQDLLYSEWNAYASALSVDRRLDLHKELSKFAGHNPAMTLSEAFDAEPAATYTALVKRIGQGDADRHYVPVIYAINRSRGFDMCGRPDRKIIQRFLWSQATSEVAASNRPRFYDC